MTYGERELVVQVCLMLGRFILAALLVFIAFKGLGNRDARRRELNSSHCRLLCEYVGDQYVGDSDAHGCWCAHDDGIRMQLRQLTEAANGC